MFDPSDPLFLAAGLSAKQARRLFDAARFQDPPAAETRLRGLCATPECRQALARSLPMLLVALSETPAPDRSLVNFERFLQAVPDRTALLRRLAENPRAVEMLVRLFGSSQFLSEILVRNPGHLEQLTQQKRLAEHKSRRQIREQGMAAAEGERDTAGKLDALRRHQRWELLRIGACDSFGLMDFKTVTVQLSLLADSLVQNCLALAAGELGVPADDFVVLAFGKLGGEELNYSSDIDLVFLSRGDAARYWPLGQKLIHALMKPTGEGFLYRVDMRLRPWGRSGALVNTVESHLEYLRKSARQWERQALLKARPIAGDRELGEEFLARAQPLIYGGDPEAVRETVRDTKARIEAELERRGRKWGHVKSGEGSIRDIEFVAQLLQLVHGAQRPEVRSINTLDALVRLADFSLLEGHEYQQLASGYVFLRTIEHSLQLMYNKQEHALPEDPRELAYLAGRLDFPDAVHFLNHYERHCAETRAIFARYVEGKAVPGRSLPRSAQELFADHRARMEPSYAETFTEEEIARHGALLARLSEENIVEVEAAPVEAAPYEECGVRSAECGVQNAGSGMPGSESREKSSLRTPNSAFRTPKEWRVTVAGFDRVGDLSIICGLLFVYGFNITDGNVFTAEQVAATHRGGKPAGAEKPAVSPAAAKFVDVFTVRPPRGAALPEAWKNYRDELAELMRLSAERGPRDAQGALARRVAEAVRDLSGPAPHLYPVEIDIDNDASERFTVLHIRAEDTIGFLYELTNALTLSGVDISRVIVGSAGDRVYDTLYVRDEAGRKILDEDRLKELRAAIVLIKHFTHLLPRSPNPESALLRFRDFLEQLFRQPNWLRDLSSLQRTEVLHTLANVLGVSDFLWEDFLRLQHANLFPVVTDIEALSRRKSRAELEAELDRELRATSKEDPDARDTMPATQYSVLGTQYSALPTPHSELPAPNSRAAALNAFKDREMFRIDLRHIMGHIAEFGQFSEELTEVAEVVVAAALRIARDELQARFGTPLRDEGGPCPLAVCALGKCGGRELGYASDIELMFVYEANGRTTGPQSITTAEFFQKLVEKFQKAIRSRQEGIFHVDLRLRPYGRAGSLAVALDAFRSYFAPEGAAWPYERQSLVKLRPIAGDAEFGRRLAALRDELIYTGAPFDVAAMRAMREKQVAQLVRAATINAKLSPGGLVDCEYLVQGLQIAHGHADPALRATNTLEAMAALAAAGWLAPDEHVRLREAYVFLRRLIDALRMVRGHARDLTVPPPDGDEFQYLARRLGYRDDSAGLQRDLDRAMRTVQALGRLLERRASRQ
ncbi:MAG: glutamine synthetase adenylyltransferase [Planctomycetales bacterium]